jgi:DNA-binding YbaB/EbfC family protein
MDPFAGGLGDMLRQAQELQGRLLDAQQQAAAQIVEGQSGGGVVRIGVTGSMEFRSVHIDPAAVDPDDVEMLEALVLAALHDAVNRVDAINQAGVGDLLGGLGGLAGLGDLGGMGSLGGLGDLGGLDSQDPHALGSGGQDETSSEPGE